ncbi:hypothetical protein [Streptomyces barringtoniae]|uniref:hypothetical protein n=1 Tax=Streptomyces barringtoniae TaxID=2892029 RepID=UPI001E53DA63|nr:hypothetical protein [Streptomyces barringtoniae]MCC5481256.1 hypothetical protein [Streptomyces barringtoniae]
MTHTPWAPPSAHDRLHAVPPSVPAPETDHATGYGTGGEPSPGASGGAPGHTVTPRASRLSILPTYQEPTPDRPAGHPESSRPESSRPDLRPAPRNDPPDALIRLRFADAIALGRAGAAFGAGSGPGLGDAWSDPATLTLQISADAGIETLRAVLAVLDAAAVTAESLTVHTHELDDVLAAFTSLP